MQRYLPIFILIPLSLSFGCVPTNYTKPVLDLNSDIEIEPQDYKYLIVPMPLVEINGALQNVVKKMDIMNLIKTII